MDDRTNENDRTWRPRFQWEPRPADLTLVLESRSFHVHKHILEKSSDYFSAMFSSQMIETTKDIIDLHLIKSEHFEILIESFYAGKLEGLTEDNVFGVVQAAQMLHIRSALLSECIDFMRNHMVNMNHCLQVMYFCMSLNIQELYSDSRRFCLAHFPHLKQTSSFFNLSISELSDYLSDRYLVVDDEMQVVDALHTWIQENKTSSGMEEDNLRRQIHKIVSSCVHLKDIPDACSVVVDAVLLHKCLPVEKLQVENFVQNLLIMQ